MTIVDTCIRLALTNIRHNEPLTLAYVRDTAYGVPTAPRQRDLNALGLCGLLETDGQISPAVLAYVRQEAA